MNRLVSHCITSCSSLRRKSAFIRHQSTTKCEFDEKKILEIIKKNGYVKSEQPLVQLPQSFEELLSSSDKQLKCEIRDKLWNRLYELEKYINVNQSRIIFEKIDLDQNYPNGMNDRINKDIQFLISKKKQLDETKHMIYQLNKSMRIDLVGYVPHFCLFGSCVFLVLIC